MDDFDPANSFGPDVAARYDDEQRGDEAETADFLTGLAGTGPALELAIGTGRIALPLAERGVRVDGVELSQAMVDRLRAKPGGDRLRVSLRLARGAGPDGAPGRTAPARPLVGMAARAVHRLQ